MEKDLYQPPRFPTTFWISSCLALQTFLQTSFNLLTDSVYVVNIIQQLPDSILNASIDKSLLSLCFCSNSELNDNILFFYSSYSRISTISQRSYFWESTSWYISWLYRINCLLTPFDHTNSSTPLTICSNPTGSQRYCTWHMSIINSSRCSWREPSSLSSNELWQRDVTHYPPFKPFHFVHVTTDTFSAILWATTQQGEQAHSVQAHLLECFAILGHPQTIKTDNAPACISHKLCNFFVYGILNTS